MRGNELLDKMELIDPAYIEAADTAPNKRKSVWAKWGTLAACLCLVCVLADFEERTGGLWNICLVQKQRANGAFQKDGCRNFVRGSAYRAFQNLVVCG